MADNDWKKRLGVVFSTNPDFQYEQQEEEQAVTLEPAKQNLIVTIGAPCAACLTRPSTTIRWWSAASGRKNARHC